MKRYDLIVEQCDSDIRAGRSPEAAKRLKELNIARVPHIWRLPLAKTCRRAGLYSTGLLLLSRLIHGTKAQPSPQELAEYGALLLRSGAVSEAERYLIDADANVAPDALLYRAYAHFIRWEFADAISHLENYLKADIAPYARLVAQTNLGYALVEDRQHTAALKLLGDVVETATADGHKLLQRNARCYRAQAYFQDGDFARARSEIAFIQSQSEGGLTNDELVILKYQFLYEGLENRDLRPINRLRELAVQNRDSASIREADLFSLKIKFDLERFLFLYFGTPYKAFRDRISKELNFSPDREVYVLGQKDSPRFDLATGLIDGKAILNPGYGCHQLLDIFLQDFYQPMRIPALFSMLFPSDHFNPNSAPDRVHQVIRRARRWLEEARIPVEIQEDEGFYSLNITGRFSFRVPLQRIAVDPMVLQFQQVTNAFERTGTFSAPEIRAKLNLPKTTIFRLLKWATENKQVERIEMGSTILYRKIAS